MSDRPLTIDFLQLSAFTYVLLYFIYSSFLFDKYQLLLTVKYSDCLSIVSCFHVVLFDGCLANFLSGIYS